KPLAEYFIESRRNQTLAYEFSAQEAENYLNEWSRCAPLYFYNNDTTTDFTSAYRGCDDMVRSISFRTRDYWRQLATLNVTDAWRKYDGNVALGRIRFGGRPFRS